jgi:DNA-binding transcriptional LysR family regulator
MAKLPKLKSLELFVAVVDGATMTEVGERMHLSQPAISTQVKSLEGFYGAPLLERRGRRVLPTDLGTLVADYARRILGLVSELGEAVADIEGLRGGRFEVGASASVGETLVPELLSRFSQAHPGVEIKLRIGNSADITEAVRRRELPFGIVGRDDHDAELEARPVIDDDMVVFAATGHRLQGAASLRTADLLAETFVLREQGSATRDVALSALSELDCLPRRSVQFGSNEAVKRAVGAGLGIGVLSLHTLGVDIAAGSIRPLRPVDWRCRRQFWLVRRRDRLASTADRAFFGLLDDARRSAEPSPDGGLAPI